MLGLPFGLKPINLNTYIGQQNNMKTSYCVHRMTEHYFPLKNQSIKTQLLSNQGVHMGRFQRSDVTAAPRTHTSEVTFSKFQFQSTCYE